MAVLAAVVVAGTNPKPDTVLAPGQVLIVIGTSSQLASLVDATTSRP